MRPLTDHCPKPLLKAGGKPLLQWHIEALVAVGIDEIVINHAHLGHQIEAYFGSGEALGATLRYSAEPVALETAGGVRKALPLLCPGGSKAPFLVINGDVFCNWPLQKALQVAQAWQSTPCEGRLAHLVLVNNPDHNSSGDFGLTGELACDKTGQGPNHTFSGIGIYSPTLFEHLPLGEVAKLAPLLREAMQAGKVSGELHLGRWMDIGTPQRLTELNDILRAEGSNHNEQ